MILATMCALVMSLPGVGVITLIGTFGLGIPVVFAATGVLYGLCAAPLVILWSGGGWQRAAGALTAAVLVGLAAIVPNYIGRLGADHDAKALRTSDYVKVPPQRPSTIELRVSRPGWSFVEACGRECHELLQSGQAQWIRIVMSTPYGRPAATPSTFHRALHGAACAPPGAMPDDKAICVVAAADPGDAANLVVDIPTPPAFGVGSRASVPWRLWSVVSHRVVVAQLRDAGQLSETMRQTEVTASVVLRPTLLGPSGTGLYSAGTDFMRETYTVNPLTLAGVLTGLGYALDAPVEAAPTFETARQKMDEPIDDAMTREMISVLDLPGDAPFNEDQMATISKWIQHARNVKDWTPDLIAVLRRFVRDRRVRRPTFFTGIFVSRPDVAAALLPDILDMIDIDGIGRDYTPAREAAYTFDRIDEKLLTPYAGRIVALLDRSPDVRAILLPAIGRIGVDPLPYLTPILADRTAPSQYSMSPRVIGACRADARWAKGLIPALRSAYSELTGTGRRDVAYRELLMKALTNLGDDAFVDHELAISTGIDAERLQRGIASDKSRKDPANWLCRW